MTEGLSGMLGGLLGGGSGGGPLQSLLKLVGSQAGGLGGLLSKFTGSDNPEVAKKAQSWVSTGDNQPVSPDEIEQALGTDTIAQVAQDAGVSHDQAKSELADKLPQLVDKISPDGNLPDMSNLPGGLGKFLGGQ